MQDTEIAEALQEIKATLSHTVPTALAEEMFFPWCYRMRLETKQPGSFAYLDFEFSEHDGMTISIYLNQQRKMLVRFPLAKREPIAYVCGCGHTEDDHIS